MSSTASSHTRPARQYHDALAVHSQAAGLVDGADQDRNIQGRGSETLLRVHGDSGRRRLVQPPAARRDHAITRVTRPYVPSPSQTRIGRSAVEQARLAGPGRAQLPIAHGSGEIRDGRGDRRTPRAAAGWVAGTLLAPCPRVRAPDTHARIGSAMIQAFYVPGTFRCGADVRWGNR